MIRHKVTVPVRLRQQRRRGRRQRQHRRPGDAALPQDPVQPRTRLWLWPATVNQRRDEIGTERRWNDKKNARTREVGTHCQIFTSTDAPFYKVVSVDQCGHALV
jgi:hypothetical protein